MLAEKRVPEAMCAHSAYVQELDKAIEYVQKADKEYEEEVRVGLRQSVYMQNMFLNSGAYAE